MAPESEADDAADDADQAGLGHELADDPAARATDGALDADLAGPLGDAHGHRVDDRQATDDEADDRDADDDRVEDQGGGCRPAGRSRRWSSWSRWRAVHRCWRASASASAPRPGRRRSARPAGSRSSAAPIFGGSVARNSSWAAASGTIAVVSGAVTGSAAGCRRSSNGTPRRSIVPPTGAPNSRAMSEPRTTTCDPSSLCRRGGGPGPAWIGELVEPVDRRQPRAPTMIFGMPKPENSTCSNGIWTCGSTAATSGIDADLVGDSQVDRHHADADAAGRAVADDDLADVVVAAARQRSALILLAIELKTTSAQIPMTMPRMVSVVRSFRRESSRRRRMMPPSR